MSAEIECYCNSLRHYPSDHPVKGCISVTCHDCRPRARRDPPPKAEAERADEILSSAELARMAATVVAERAVVEAALRYVEHDSADTCDGCPKCEVVWAELRQAVAALRTAHAQPGRDA